ncbi:MAG: hypothetical protein R3E01_26655 [Pirellulaceae bacterium]|nr:hypothetical protein [Planctomycetales bacterium]
MTTDTASKVVEEAFQNINKAAEAGLKMQQEMLRQWTSMWPAIPTPQTVVTDKVRDFQKQWSNAVSDISRKHRDVIDRQYQAAVESLDAALRVGESTTPEEYRRRFEQLCRKTLECMRESTETQLKEFQDVVTKWTELVTQATT